MASSHSGIIQSHTGWLITLYGIKQRIRFRPSFNCVTVLHDLSQYPPTWGHCQGGEKGCIKCHIASHMVLKATSITFSFCVQQALKILNTVINTGSKQVYLWHRYKSRTTVLTLANSIGLGRRHITMTSNLTSHTVFSHLVTNWGLSFSTRLPTSSSIIYAVEWNHWKTMLTRRAKLSVGVFSLGVQRLTCKQNVLSFSLSLLQIALWKDKKQVCFQMDWLTKAHNLGGKILFCCYQAQPKTSGKQ